MKLLLVFPFFFLCACNSLPQLYQAAEEIATDDAIEISIDRDCFQKDTNVKVNIEVINKETKD